jgi:hypothetical protein
MIVFDRPLVVFISATYKMNNIEIFQRIIKDTKKWIYDKINKLDIFNFI